MSNSGYVATTRCGSCESVTPVDQIRLLDAGLLISKSRKKDKKHRYIIIDLSGRAWRRVCINCSKACMRSDRTLWSLTKSEFIPCTSPDFEEFCEKHADIAAHYKLGAGVDKWKIPSIYSNDQSGQFIDGKSIAFPVSRFFEEDDVFDVSGVPDLSPITSTNTSETTHTSDSKCQTESDDIVIIPSTQFRSRVCWESQEIRLLYDFLNETKYDGIMNIKKYLKATNFLQWYRKKNQIPRKDENAYAIQYALYSDSWNVMLL